MRFSDEWDKRAGSKAVGWPVLVTTFRHRKGRVLRGALTNTYVLYTHSGSAAVGSMNLKASLAAPKLQQHKPLPPMPSARTEAARHCAPVCIPCYTSLRLPPCHARRQRFTHRTLQLLGVAALTGLFTGTRGGIFTVANTRLNVRLRKALFHSLLRCVAHATVHFCATYASRFKLQPRPRKL